MKKTLLRLCVAAIALGQLSFAALNTDGVDQVTYGVFTYKWKNLVDTLYIHKIKETPYAYYKLGSLTSASPFIGTYELGFGTPLGGNKDAWLAFAATYADNTSWTSSNYTRVLNTNQYTVNGTNMSTNGGSAQLTNQFDYDQNPAMRDAAARVFEGSLSFGKKIGDSYLNMQYQLSLTGNLTSEVVNSMNTLTSTNGSLSSTGNSRATNRLFNDQGNHIHTLGFGLLSGTFELQGFAKAAFMNRSFNYFQTNDVYTTVIASGSGDFNERVASQTSTITMGNSSAANASALSANASSVLKHTLLTFHLSPRVENIGDMKFYLTGEYATGIFDPSANALRSISDVRTFNTNGGAVTNRSITEDVTEYINPSYSKFDATLRMKRVWKGDKVSFGVYPRYILNNTYSSMSRQRTLLNTTMVDTNGNGNYSDMTSDTNWTKVSIGGIDTKNVNTWSHEFRLPVAAQWKMTKEFTLYAGATARFSATTVTTTTHETGSGNNTGLEYLKVSYTNNTTPNTTIDTASVTTTEGVAVTTLLQGSYSAGLLWTPSANLEFMVTFNGEHPLNYATDAGLFNGVDLNVIWNF